MGNRILKISNLKKTFYYLKKNGWKNAYYAALERVGREKEETYCYEAPSEEVLEVQRKESEAFAYRFSILVPAYETKPEYLRGMMDSVLKQSYGNWELIIADASESDRVKKTIAEYTDERIHGLFLNENRGISDNTNAALQHAAGDYIGLLDHDDVLTPDALYEMAKAIGEAEKSGRDVRLLYSDEDKGNGALTDFYEPHRKIDFNMDLLLSNNYVCHFLVMKAELMKELGFRREYDGAQDYDLTLRAAEELLYEKKLGRNTIVHIPKVLYHWRCHESSTAENPESKRYAYDAGRRALEAFMERRGWRGTVCDSKHLGFYRIAYEGDILQQRPEVGAYGGKLLNKKKRVAGGIYDATGSCPYLGLHREFSGYMHRASLPQEAYALDIRGMRVRKEVQGIYEEVFGRPYGADTERQRKGSESVDFSGNVSIGACMEFGKRVREAGYTLVWLPDWEIGI